MDKEIASLEESIRQLDQEIVIDPAQSPKFIAVLCLAAKDLSEIAQVPPEKTLYAAYILPKTSFILLAHETGSRVTSILKHILICPFYMQKIHFTKQLVTLKALPKYLLLILFEI